MVVDSWNERGLKVDYTESTIEAERFGLLNSLDKEEVLSWLRAPAFGRIEQDWEEE